MQKYKEASIDKIDKKLHAKIKKLVEVNENEKKIVFSKGLFLYGGTGTGKTYILQAIKNRLREISHRTGIVYENWVDLLIDLRSDFNMLRSRIDDITSKDVIMLDDLGSEKQTEWSQEILYAIVNKAYNTEKRIFLATNLSLQQFEDKYGDRILSRLGETCEMLEIKGEDRRLE